MISTAVFLDGYTLLFKKLKTTKKNVQQRTQTLNCLKEIFFYSDRDENEI